MTRKKVKKEKEIYPSAKILLEASYQDYIRLLDSYDKINEKVNMILAFIGIILGFFLNYINLKFLNRICLSLKISELLLYLVHSILLFICIITLIYCIVKIFALLKGKYLPVFKSEDIREVDLLKESEENVALWLIDNYTNCSKDIRPIINYKQKELIKVIKATIILTIVMIIILILQKGGY